MSGIDLRRTSASAALTAPMGGVLRFGPDPYLSPDRGRAMGLGNRGPFGECHQTPCVPHGHLALRTLIAEDRMAALNPACVIATAGTVNTGAIDDLVAVRGPL